MSSQERTDRVRVGVLSCHNSKETKAILNAVADLDHEPVWIRQENVRSWIDDDGVHLEPDVDILANRLLLTKRTNPHELLRLASLYHQQCPVLNPPTAVERTMDKYHAATRLRSEGISVPDAYLALSRSLIDQWSEYLSNEAVQKPTVGTNGRHLERITRTDPVNVTVDGKQAFLQEYIDATNGRASDIRVYVVEDEIVGAMRRTAQDGEWRANVALGADVEDVTHTLNPEPRTIARDAVSALGLDYAGVDLINENGQWYVLEVNATAGFKGLFEATGCSVAPYIARLAISRVGGDLDDDRVADLATTLDDSVPECKPDLSSDADSKSVLGYTSVVQVSGSETTESVVAKADTGAKRTSIGVRLAGRLGVGPITGTTTVRSGAATQSETRPLVELNCKVGGYWQTVTASITDREELTYPMILGRDVLREYQLDIERRVDEE